MTLRTGIGRAEQARRLPGSALGLAIVRQAAESRGASPKRGTPWRLGAAAGTLRRERDARAAAGAVG
jgi:hypothetical protein